HHARGLPPLAEDRLRGVTPQMAAATAGGRLAKRLQRAPLGEEWGGVVGVGVDHLLVQIATRAGAVYAAARVPVEVVGYFSCGDRTEHLHPRPAHRGALGS